MLHEKSAIDILRREIVDLTDSAFDVKIEYDSNGPHLSAYIEDPEISLDLPREVKEIRVILLAVPIGYLAVFS